MLINNKPIVSMDISSDGEIIATVNYFYTIFIYIKKSKKKYYEKHQKAFANSREINLWHNVIYMKP